MFGFDFCKGSGQHSSVVAFDAYFNSRLSCFVTMFSEERVDDQGSLHQLSVW